MSGWTKLFGSIVTSSVWIEPHPVLRVWVAMLALADANGIVEGSIPGFANLCRVTIPEMEEAILKFSSPDLYSRSPEAEGRRIESVPGGWRIINRNKYRDRNQDAPGSRAAYFREYRKNVAQRSAQQLNVARNTETETEKEIKKEIIKKESCGEIQNVILTTIEKEKVSPDEIAALSTYLASTGKKYKSHYATILNWRRKNGALPPKTEIKKTFPNCPKCGKETTNEDIKKFDSCPACYKPLPPEKLKQLLSNIGKDVK